MSKINLTINGNVVTGKQISFIAPCSCSDITCLIINNTEYMIVDALGSNIAGTDAWANGAIVSVILNVEDEKAYVQNPASSNVDVNQVIDALPRTTALDFTNWSNGYIKETLVDGRVITIPVRFDVSGIPTTIGDIVITGVI